MAYKEPIARVTPFGVARFPHLNKPDGKFKPENPEFKVNLVVPDAEAETLRDEVADMLARLMSGDEEMIEHLPKTERDAFRTKLKAKKLKVSDPPSVVADTDEEGDPTGSTVFKIKANSKRKDKSGKLVDNSPPVIKDAKNQPTKATVTGGSTIRCLISLIPWCNPKGECGIKLRLIGVQIKELRAGMSADFGEVDGYDGVGAGDPDEGGADAPSGAADGNAEDLDDEIPF